MSNVSFSFIQTGVKAGSEIKSGDTVVLKVIKSLTGGRWQVSHDGRLLIIESTVKLKAGQVIRTKASTSGARVILRLARNPLRQPAGNVTTAAGRSIRDNTFAKTIMLAFKRSGLRVDTPLYRSAKATFFKLADRSRTAASVLAALAEKDISPETNLVDFVTPMLGGDGEAGEGAPRHRSNHDDSGPSNLSSIIEQLKIQIETPAEEENPLHLFNHLKGKVESWILLPYKVKQGGLEVSGTIRLRVGRSGDIRRVAFDASAGRFPYMCTFSWPFAEGDAVKVGCADKSMLRLFTRRANELPEKLRNLKSINDDNSSEDDLFDGLALEGIIPVEGVDKFA